MDAVQSNLNLLWKTIAQYADQLRVSVNDMCNGMEPWQVAAYAFGATCIVVWIQSLLRSDQPLGDRLKKWFFKKARGLPFVKQRIAKELAKAKVDIGRMVHGSSGDNQSFYLHLPEKGLGKDLVPELEAYSEMGHIDWKGGVVSGAVYDCDPELYKIQAKVFEKFGATNPLHPDVFPGIRKMEAEIVRMTAHIFHGDRDVSGVVTSGGTESLLLACLTYRNRAYALGITEPEMVIPVTAHAAFDKAGELFRIQVKHIPVDPVTMKPVMSKMRRAITGNTCMLVGSAPDFAHGIIDPIAEIGRLGERYKIPVHVDSCLGGFLLPFMDAAGYPVDAFDFRLPGVTSISADTHKYAFAPKGTSVVLYRTQELGRYQFFCQPNWPGGVYVTPTIAGSRPGVNIAACWTALMYHGRQGYIKSTKSIIEAARYIRAGIEGIEGLQVMADPKVSVVGISSTAFNIYNFNDMLSARGWALNPLQFPQGVHFAVTHLTATRPGVKERFVRDCEECAAEMRKNPGRTDEGSAAIYGLAQQLPDRSLVSEFAFLFLDACYDVNPGSSQKKTQ